MDVMETGFGFSRKVFLGENPGREREHSIRLCDDE